MPQIQAPVQREADAAAGAGVMAYENAWIPNKTNTAWSMHLFPFFLIIEYRPREPLPFVGTLQGKCYTKRDHHAWPGINQAAEGMLRWAQYELYQTYQMISGMLPPPTT